MYFSNAVLSTMGALVTASVLSATVNAGHLYDGGLEQHYGDYNHNYHQAVAGEYEYKVWY